MAKKAPANGPKGVDAWTNNGHGLKVKSALSKDEIKALAADVKRSAAKRKK